ncbi:MAG: DPP IV N-terminal domain-containing protein, partial [Gemmatimonadota bacterium]
MKRLALNTAAVLFLSSIAIPHDASSQVPRGRDLYDHMGTARLTRTDGSGNVMWLPGGQGYYRRGDLGFVRIDPVTGRESSLFNPDVEATIQMQYAQITGEAADRLPFTRFQYVDDATRIRFDGGGKYLLFDFDTNELRELKRPGIEPQPYSQDLMRGMQASQLWNGSYSPDWSQFAYVKEYDLYISNTVSGEEKRLTFDGSLDTFNGRPNWVYPEEFSQRDAYWWSPDSRKLAYYRSDESGVHKYPIVHDLEPEAELELQSYPKAGEPNPIVVLKIVDIETGETVEIETNSTPDNYIVRPFWLPSGEEILLQRINRNQNVLELLAANVSTGHVRTVLVEEEEAFVNLRDDFRLLSDGQRFLWSSERSGYRQLYLYSLDGTELSQLTSDENPVSSVVQIDENEEWLYYTANTELGLETHFFRVRLDGSGQTVKLTREPGSHRISMDPAGQYYVDSYSSFTTAPTANLHRADG